MNYTANTCTVLDRQGHEVVGQADGSHLGDLERAVLEAVPTTGWSMTAKPSVDFMNDPRTPGQKAAEWTPAHLDHDSAVIVWKGEFGVAMGAVRARRAAGQAGRTEDTYEASPFPGGWCEVPVSQIILVRHPQTI